MQRQVYRQLTAVRPGANVYLDRPGKDDDIELGGVQSIIGVGNDYIVFVNLEGMVRSVALESNLHQRVPEFERNVNRAWFLQQQLRMLGPTHDPGELDSLRHMIGTATQSGYLGHHEVMDESLTYVEELLSWRVRNNARQLYNSAAIRLAAWVVGLALLGVIVGILLEAQVVWGAELLEAGVFVLLGVLGGGMGALLSILISTESDRALDPRAAAHVANHEARNRMIMGVLAGVIVVACLVSGLLSSTAVREAGKAGILIVAVAAGFTERFVPSVLVGHPFPLGYPSSPPRRPGRGLEHARPQPEPRTTIKTEAKQSAGLVGADLETMVRGVGYAAC